MATPLSAALREETAAIVDAPFRALQGEWTLHYRGAGENLLRRRCQALMTAFVESCEGETDSFAQHVRRLAHERITEGHVEADDEGQRC